MTGDPRHDATACSSLVAGPVTSVEYTTSEALPIVNVYSRGEVKKLFEASGFRVRGLWVRKLVHQDLPAALLWKWVPQSWLDGIVRRWAGM